MTISDTTKLCGVTNNIANHIDFKCATATMTASQTSAIDFLYILSGHILFRKICIFCVQWSILRKVGDGNERKTFMGPYIAPPHTNMCRLLAAGGS